MCATCFVFSSQTIRALSTPATKKVCGCFLHWINSPVSTSFKISAGIIVLACSTPFILPSSISIACLVASMLFAFVLTGCNTVKGVGKDVSKAGDAVSNSADKVEKKL